MVPTPVVAVPRRAVPSAPVVLVVAASPASASRVSPLPGRVAEPLAVLISPRAVGHKQLRLLQQLDGLGTGAQLGDGDAVGLQLVERGLGLRGGHPGRDRVLEAVAVGDDLLALRRGEEGDQALRLRLVLRGLRMPAPDTSTT